MFFRSWSRFPPAGFEAQALAHPLMPESHAIRNDVRLGGETRLWIVSGSNMSGKSTLLRTIGINTVLAWAGAPVRAATAQNFAAELGRIHSREDSLQDGRSRFYAEITRLREIIALTGGPRPVLFLLDELLSGTNSHDRQIGAAGIVQALIDHGAMGLDHHARSGAGPHRRRSGQPRRQRSLRRHAAER